MAVQACRQSDRNCRRHGECNLHRQPIHWMPFGKTLRPAHKAEGQLGQGEDENSAKDQNCNCRTEGD